MSDILPDEGRLVLIYEQSTINDRIKRYHIIVSLKNDGDFKYWAFENGEFFSPVELPLENRRRYWVYLPKEDHQTL